jgi:predicted PurR-regulated permease PerM
VAVLLPSIRTHKPGAGAGAILALTCIIAMLYFGRVFFITVALSIMFAFILEPFVGLLVKWRIPRALASFAVCSVALLLLYLGGLAFFFQAESLVAELPKYSERVSELVESATARLEQMERRAEELLVPKRLQRPAPPPPPEPKAKAAPRKRAEPVAAEPTPPGAGVSEGVIQEVRIRPDRTPLVGFIYARLSGLYIFLLMASFVPFLVYFMLSWRDHLYRSFMRLFESEERVIADRTWEGIAAMVRGFVVGNFVLAILLAVTSTIAFWLFNLPYAFVVGPLSGFLSVVPYIGLPLSMVPPFFAAITTYSGIGPYILIGSTVAVLHLLALNLLYPKIVGARVHLNPLVVTLALMFWTVLWGEVGLVLAIPITAGIKAVCDNVSSLQPYGKLLGD